MAKFIKTGVDGLDTILGGGFLAHNSILLKGAPGTGKTSLGIQILLQGIEEEGQGGVICSFEQFPQQLMRDAEAFGWNLQDYVDSGKLVILFVKPDDLVTPPGQSDSALLTKIFEATERVGAQRLLLDSLSHFSRFNADPQTRRDLAMQFVNEVKADGVTPILTAELSEGNAFEEYLVDEVLYLHNDTAYSAATLPERTVEIKKTRGHAHVPGHHPFEFSAKGLKVYPHILPEPFGQDELGDATLEPVSCGVPGIDRMVRSGFPRGRAVMVAGMPGAYKTSLAASFLAEGAKSGEAGLLITFQETPQHLLAMLKGRGIDLSGAIEDGTVRIRHYVPHRSSLDAVFADMLRDIDGGVRRVVIDSVDDFERAVGNPNAYKDYLNMFVAALCRADATVLLTQKIETVGGANPLSQVRYLSMVDTVVYLGSVEIESEIHKVVSVLKSRAAQADTDLREIVCTGEGLRVLQKFHGLSGILQGTPHGKYKKTVEEVFQPLYFIRDFATMAAGEGVEETQRQQVLADILKQAESLDRALKEHLGFDPEDEKKR